RPCRRIAMRPSGRSRGVPPFRLPSGRDSSMISTSTKPRWRARAHRSYWRRLLSRWVITWDCVDWRTYTTAFLLRTTAGITSALVIFKLLDAEACRLHEDLGQHRDDLVPLDGGHPFQPAVVE